MIFCFGDCVRACIIFSEDWFNDPHNLDGILQNAEARNNESSVSKRREAIPGRITFLEFIDIYTKWQQ